MAKIQEKLFMVVSCFQVLEVNLKKLLNLELEPHTVPSNSYGKDVGETSKNKLSKRKKKDCEFTFNKQKQR